VSSVPRRSNEWSMRALCFPGITSRRVIASRVPGVAMCQPAQASAQSFDWPVFPERFDHVSAARRLEAARRTEQGAERDLIESDRTDQDGDHAVCRPPPDSHPYGPIFGHSLFYPLATDIQPEIMVYGRSNAGRFEPPVRPAIDEPRSESRFAGAAARPSRFPTGDWPCSSETPRGSGA
jgi:hypothetical protein